MSDQRSRARQPKAARKPLDSARLEQMALTYVARFSTTAAKLERYLQRKLRERGWDGEREPPLAALVERCVDLGFVDDEGYARAKAGSLLRRGFGARRVRQALAGAGVAEELQSAVRPTEAAARRAVLALARKRGFGPFAVQPLDRPTREKHIAAMLRAGHSLESARQIADAASVTEAEQWAAEADDETEC